MALSLLRVPPQRGAVWIRDAFRLFGRRPVAFTGLFFVFLFAAMMVLFVPVVGGLLQMMTLPMLSLGFMVAARSALAGGPVQPGQFVEPLTGDRQRRIALLTLCVVYGVGAALLLWLCNAISGGSLARLQELLAAGDSAREEMDALMAEPDVFLGTVVGLLGATLWSIPFWHAPALVYWGGQSAGHALFSSTVAVWRCKGAFLVYSIVWAGVIGLFGAVAAIVLSAFGAPQLAGLMALPAGLMFSTVFYVSLIFTFDDSFGRGEDASTYAELGS